jgi:hypothetical protein
VIAKIPQTYENLNELKVVHNSTIKLLEYLTAVDWYMHVDRQTDRQADTCM